MRKLTFACPGDEKAHTHVSQANGTPRSKECSFEV